jgi:glycosyltransferase involved in cell wall biosynthesis
MRSLVNIPQIIGLNLAARRIYSQIVRSPLFKGFLANSTVPLTRSRLDATPHAVLHPPVAIDANLTRYRREKADYAICVSRISKEKGVMDLPSLWRHVVRRNPDAKLFVFGAPSNLSNTIIDMAEKRGISRNLFLVGYRPANELYTAISRARVMVFPSRLDTYPMAPIESLALGTPVVTHDIEPFSSMFSEIDAVQTIAEQDFPAMAEEICRWMNAGEDEYRHVFQSHQLNEFLALHSSWERVALSERENLALLMDEENGAVRQQIH